MAESINLGAELWVWLHGLTVVENSAIQLYRRTEQKDGHCKRYEKANTMHCLNIGQIYCLLFCPFEFIFFFICQ